MSRFIIPITDSYGNKVYFQTSNHKGDEAIRGYDSVILWLEKNGFRITTVETPTKHISEQPIQEEKHCPTCGQLMSFKEGVSKTGKPWKGYFCPERGHEPIWVK